MARAKRTIIMLALFAPLAALAVVAGMALAPAARARADAAPATMPTAKPVTTAPKVAPPPAPAAPQIEPGMTLKRVLDTGGPIKFGDWFWDDKGVPAGPTVITIDLDAQVLSIFRDGYEIGTSAIIYGADEKPTPLGTFPILQKDADHVSTIYTGAPMPYMLRLTWDGVSIHGSPVDPTYATHGCIGVPKPFAKELFAATKLGDKVIVTKGKMMAGA
jgi:lipoprotein-anchoring transpeptidase ErfK/SrfK